MHEAGHIPTGLVAAASDPNALRSEESGTGGAQPHAVPEVTATVSEPPPPPPPVVADPEMVKRATRLLVQLPKDLDNEKLTKMAGELAKDIREEGTILSDYGLTAAHLEYLKEHNDFFKNTLASATLEWRGVKNTSDRVKLHAAAILEETLLHVGNRMLRPGENLNGVVEAGKFLAKVAGLDTPDKAQGVAGGRFNISINIGAGQTVAHQSPTVTISAKPEGD